MKTTLAALCLLLLSVGALGGQVMVGGEFQVSSSTAAGQGTPSVAIDGDGDFVVVWRKKAYDSTTTANIQGRRFRSDGTRRGPEFRVNAPTGGNRYHPDVVMAADGSFVVVWQDGSPYHGDGRDGSGAGIFSRRFAANGTARSGVLQVNRTTAGQQFAPAAAATGDGGFVVVWTGAEDEDGHASDIFAQRFAAGGRRVGRELQVNSLTRGAQRDPTVGADGSGNFVVVWRSANGEDGYYGVSVTRIYGRRFAADAKPRGGDFRVGSASGFLADYQYRAQVAVSETGPFAVVWDVYAGERSFFDIHAQLFSADGSPRTDELQVNTQEGEPVSQFEAVTSMAPSGELVVAWNGQGQNGSAIEGSIVARRLRLDGTAMEDEFLVNSYTPGDQNSPSVAMTPDGDFVVVWASTQLQQTSIRAQRYTVSVAPSFTWSPASPGTDEPVRFTDLSTGNAPSSWAWSFGDGAVSSEQSPVHTYRRPGSFPVGLTVSDGFGRASASAVLNVRGSCVAGPTALCLGDGRFLVEVEWRDFAGATGSGRVVPTSSSDSGLFYFFNAENWEMLVKVLDGCHVNGRFWVFAAATTNVEYTLRVTDALAGKTKSYENPLGTAAAAITDTGAFATCP